jgi:hypothetical protein
MIRGAINHQGRDGGAFASISCLGVEVIEVTERASQKMG